MEILLIIAVTGVMCIASFFVGAWVGNKVSNGNPIEMPKLDITKPIRDRQERKQTQAERDRYAAILRNINRYDGTAEGQEDIPWR